MTAQSAPPTPADPLAQHIDRADQRTAAQLAQQFFTEIFRHAFGPETAGLPKAVASGEAQLIQWCELGGDTHHQLARMALLVHGLDQWGLAYTRAFNLKALPALSALIGNVRSRLDPKSDAIFQQFFSQIGETEAAAIDFKVDLRRSIHLALWHAMAACEQAEEAAAIVQPLGSMMLALHQDMPTLGWRLLADALAHIQIALLGNPGLSDTARDATQQLFDALLHALPKDTALLVLRQSGQAVIAWQQGQRMGQAH